MYPPVTLGHLRLYGDETISGLSPDPSSSTQAPDNVVSVQNLSELCSLLVDQLVGEQQLFPLTFRNKVLLMLKVCDSANNHPEHRAVIAPGNNYGCDFVTYPGGLLFSPPSHEVNTRYAANFVVSYR